jgi:carbonic anhydrase
MLTFTSEALRGIVKNAEPGNTEVAKLVDNIDFHTFGNLEESVKTEVKYLQEHPLVLKGTKVTGWVYDVKSGTVSRRLRFARHRIALNFSCRSSRLCNFQRRLRAILIM